MDEYTKQKLINANISPEQINEKKIQISELNTNNLAGCDLRGFSIIGYEHEELTVANFNGADLRNTYLHIKAEYATFIGVDLRGANLQGSIFDHTNFSGSDLRGANLCNASYCGAVFTGTDLRGAYLGNGYEKANFSGADMRGIVGDADYLKESIVDHATIIYQNDAL